MKRDEILGHDSSEKIIFCFLYENDEKVISLFVRYSDENTMNIAKQSVTLHSLFWKSDTRAQNLKELFETDPSLVNLGVEFWADFFQINKKFPPGFNNVKGPLHE